MCFIFLFTWLTSVFFLTFEEEKKIPADAGERRRKSLVVVVHKMLQREIVDGEISLGETASCFVMHFWFDQCYYQSLKKWIRRQHESQSWVSLQIRVSRGILRTFGPPSGRRRSDSGALFFFSFQILHHSLCAVWFFFCLGGGMSLLNQVMWAGACVHLEWTN